MVHHSFYESTLMYEETRVLGKQELLPAKVEVNSRFEIGARHTAGFVIGKLYLLNTGFPFLHDLDQDANDDGIELSPRSDPQYSKCNVVP